MTLGADFAVLYKFSDTIQAYNVTEHNRHFEFANLSQVDRFLRVWRVLSFATDAIFFRRSASSTQLGPKMLSMMSLPAKFTNGMLTINDRAPRVCVGRLLLTLLVILLTGYISLPDDT